MSVTIVNAALQLIAWGMICVLIVVLYRIARFYQITSGRRSLYRWFLVPLVLLAAAAVTDILVVGEPNLIGDALLLLGGASLIGLGYNLLRLMTGSRS
jgi:drug/metabolite transporter (DMT)-like permease